MCIKFIILVIYSYFIQYAVFLSDPCTENEVRLNDYMVQVCHDEKWGFVCEHGESWNLIAADVVCKQVGILSKCQLVTLVPHTIHIHRQVKQSVLSVSLLVGRSISLHVCLSGAQKMQYLKHSIPVILRLDIG